VSRAATPCQRDPETTLRRQHQRSTYCYVLDGTAVSSRIHLLKKNFNRYGSNSSRAKVTALTVISRASASLLLTTRGNLFQLLAANKTSVSAVKSVRCSARKQSSRQTGLIRFDLTRTPAPIHASWFACSIKESSAISIIMNTLPQIDVKELEQAIAALGDLVSALMARQPATTTLASDILAAVSRLKGQGISLHQRPGWRRRPLCDHKLDFSSGNIHRPIRVDC
jgi:hypothetical protein